VRSIPYGDTDPDHKNLIYCLELNQDFSYRYYQPKQQKRQDKNLNVRQHFPCFFFVRQCSGVYNHISNKGRFADTKLNSFGKTFMKMQEIGKGKSEVQTNLEFIIWTQLKRPK
jgi:hypothetical protein